MKPEATSAPAAPPQPLELQATGPERRPPAWTIIAALAATVLIAGCLAWLSIPLWVLVMGRGPLPSAPSSRSQKPPASRREA